MRIHNFYSDLLLSIRSLFDNHIFPGNYIKSYDFNIANQSFNTDENFETGYEFPACIVALNDENYIFGKRPNVIQHWGPENINQIAVLYNHDNQIELKLQEEQKQINISVTINCESQLQAKNIEYQIGEYLPVSKYIQFLEFTSFLEIPDEYLQTLDFQMGTHNIGNLFTKVVNNTGKVSYCYSVNYKPLIRLETVQSSISDSLQRSFQVTLELSYLIQTPQWLFCSKDMQKPERINIHYTQFGREPIADYPVQRLINVFHNPNIDQFVPKPHTQFGKWAISELSNDLLWIDGFTGENLLVAHKPISGSWGLDVNDNLYWQHIDGTKYYIDTDKDTFYEGSLDGPALDNIKNKLKIYTPINSCVRRNVIISSPDDISLAYIGEQAIFSIKFNKDDMLLKSNNRYNFIDKLGNVISNIRYKTLDVDENKVIFELLENSFNDNYFPTLTKPLIIQIIEENCDRKFCDQININNE